MNIFLWIFQAILALLCIAGGAFQMFKVGEMQATVAAMRELPHGLWFAFGLFECICGIGLILPSILKKDPKFTAFAAAAISVQSLVVSAIYLHFGDRDPIPFALTMVIVGAIIAFAQLKRKSV